MSLTEKMHADFQKIFAYWKVALDSYTENDLKKRLNEDSWTLGQVYKHLINSTLQFHLKQVSICLASAENNKEKKNFKGFLAYNILKGFPPIKIKVPASEFYTPKEPNNKNEIQEGFEKVTHEMLEILKAFEHNAQGKTKHPGFNYINAVEWYKLIEMHWRHHIRQKNALDNM
jgi:hypothetical protein